MYNSVAEQMWVNEMQDRKLECERENFMWP